MIYDPDANKPEDWDDKEYILDPEDKKPEGYDDIPKEITDPDAKKPEDWDDEEDGEWVAPTIPNLEYKGEWKPKVKSGTLFDNVLVCDDPEYAKQLAEETWGKQKDAAFEEYEKKKEEEKSSIHTCSLLDTDEIFAQMSLQPVKSENDVFHVADLGMKPSRHPTKLFCKTLTTSDTSTHGGFSMPRRAAEKLFLHWISI